MTVLIKLTEAQSGTGPFDVYVYHNNISNNGYERSKINPTPVPKSILLEGYVVDIPFPASTIGGYAEVVSLGNCEAGEGTYIGLSFTTQEHCINWTATNDRNINIVINAVLDFTAVAAGRTINPTASSASLTRFTAPGDMFLQEFHYSIPMNFTFSSSSTVATLSNKLLPAYIDFASGTITSLAYSFNVVFTNGSSNTIEQIITIPAYNQSRLTSYFNNCFEHNFENITTTLPPLCGITATVIELPDLITVCGTFSSYYFDRESYFDGTIDFNSSLIMGESVDVYQSEIYLISYSTMNNGTVIPATSVFGVTQLDIGETTNIGTYGTYVGWQGENNPNPVYSVTFGGTLVTNLRVRQGNFTIVYDTYSEGGTPGNFFPTSSANTCE
jgi:hypothetical protein